MTSQERMRQDLRHMVSVDGLLLLRLLMHPGVHLVLLGTSTCKKGELN